MKTSTTVKLQTASQLVFLALFALLAKSDKLQLWMGLFLFGMALSLFAGRVYCGWACPIHPVLRAVTWLKKKLKLPHSKIPDWMQGNAFRFGILGLFIIAVAFTMVSGKKLPVLPALIGIAALFSLFFPESLWHRWLCPYGTLLSLPARLARKNLVIDQSGCISCGKCQTLCPAQAVTSAQPASTPSAEPVFAGIAAPKGGGSPKPKIQPKTKLSYTIKGMDCLLCLECVKACPKNVIRYIPVSRNKK